MFYCLIQIELVNVSVWLKQGIQWICIWPSSFTMALHVKPEVYLFMWIPVYSILFCILIQLMHSNMTNLNVVRLSWWCRWRHQGYGGVLVGGYCLTFQRTVLPASSGSSIPWWEDCLSLKIWILVTQLAVHNCYIWILLSTASSQDKHIDDSFKLELLFWCFQ